MNYGNGAGPRSGLDTGAWTAGTRTFGVSNKLAVPATLLVAVWCTRMVFMLAGLMQWNIENPLGCQATTCFSSSASSETQSQIGVIRFPRNP